MSLDKLCGVGIPIKLKGSEYILSPLKVRDIAEIDAYVKAQRIKCFEIVNPDLSIQEKIKIRSIDPTPEEINSEMGQYAGMVYQLWLSLRHKQPALTLQAVGELVDDVDSIEEAKSALELLIGEYLKKVTGQTVGGK